MATYGSFKKLDADSIIDGTITGSDFQAASIALAKLAANSVGSTQLANNAVTQAKIQSGAVGSTALASTLDLSGKTVSYRPFVNADVSALNTNKLSGNLNSISSNGLASSAFVDTTDARMITSGTLAFARGARANDTTGFSVHPTAVTNTYGAIIWTTSNQGHITGASSNTFQFNSNNQVVTVYQTGTYISLCEVITAPSTGENDMFYHVNNSAITDFRGGSAVSNHAAVSGAIILNLNANDFIDVRCNNWHSDYYSRWSFTKLGGWA
jgi:hypothetical protein